MARWKSMAEWPSLVVKPYRNEAKPRHCWLFRVYWQGRPPGHAEAATKASLRGISIFQQAHVQASCQIVDWDQCVRMFGTEGALTGLQSSPVKRFCIFQQACLKMQNHSTGEIWRLLKTKPSRGIADYSVSIDRTTSWTCRGSYKGFPSWY